MTRGRWKKKGMSFEWLNFIVVFARMLYLPKLGTENVCLKFRKRQVRANNIRDLIGC